MASVALIASKVSDGSVVLVLHEDERHIIEKVGTSYIEAGSNVTLAYQILGQTVAPLEDSASLVLRIEAEFVSSNSDRVIGKTEVPLLPVASS